MKKSGIHLYCYRVIVSLFLPFFSSNTVGGGGDRGGVVSSFSLFVLIVGGTEVGVIAADG